MSNLKRKTSKLFIFLRFLLKAGYRKYEISGFENLPQGPTVLVGNHSQIHGPLACEFYLPENFYTWCAGQMMNIKEVPAYAYADFWSQKPKYIRPFFKIASYLIAPLCVLVFNNARTVPVFRDSRILTTFKTSINLLKENKTLVIFPEHDKKYNNIIYDFQDRFIDIAKHYYKKTGEEISFVPLYIAPNLKKMYIGKPVKFSSVADFDRERARICSYLMEEITNIGRNLPLHTVVPYRNIPKKYYPINKERQ